MKKEIYMLKVKSGLTVNKGKRVTKQSQYTL